MIKLKNTYTKLTLFFLVLILLPSIAIGAGMYYAASNIIKREVSVSVSNTLKMNAGSLDARLRNIEYLSLPLIMDDKLEGILSDATNFDTYEDAQNLSYIQEALSRVVYSSQNIESLYIMNIKNGYTVSSDNFILYKSELEGTMWSNKDELLSKIGMWNFCQSIVRNNNSHNMLSLIKRIDNEDGTLALLSLNVNRDDINGLLNSIEHYGKNYSTFIVDAIGNVAFSVNNFRLNLSDVKGKDQLISKIMNNEDSTYFIEKIGKIDYLFITYYSDYTKWRYVAVQPINDIMGSVLIIRQLTILLCIVAVVLTFALGLFFAGRIYEPIKILIKGMEQFKKGDFNTKLHWRKSDQGKITKQNNGKK